MSDIRIELVKEFDVAVYERVQDLLKNLYPERPAITREKFSQVVADDHSSVYITLVGKEVIGTSTLAFYRKLAGDKWFIEDVVVDERMRGKGIGSFLNKRMLEDARAKGADFVDVDTRSPEAYKFYLKLGFRDKTEKRSLFTLRYFLLPDGEFE